MSWGYWDTKTEKWMSMSVAPSREGAQLEIDSWKRRQERGGRRDIDVSGLIPREVDESWYRF